MKILFRQKYKYQLQLSQEQAEKKLRYITTRRFEDYSIDVVGSFGNDGRFELMNKWGLTNTELIENRRAYLEGNLASNERGTFLEVSLRPNIVFVVAFYIALLLLLCELLSVSLIPFLSPGIKIICLAFFKLFLLAIMIFSVNELKKRFERLMQLD
jgi:hypothetical protein